ncbi:MAG: AAA family ATPase [Rickettsiales bacterium]|nr:MAG: AAA family ATPase [Rickettsiales bacterium]
MNLLQIKASNPDSSIWVSASAGTGKTKILTDRVLRLLLKGEVPNKILCLTFTNAAAGEMKERITNSIFKWSSLNQENLSFEINKILGRNCSEKELILASNLYDEYIRSENNINIQTIHSFCQKLLKQFPLEAKISPSFKIIDEIKAESVLKQIKKDLANYQDLELINKYLIENFHELIIDEIFSEIIQQKSKFLQKNISVDNLYQQSEKLINKLNTSFEDRYHALKSNSLIHSIVGFNISTQELKKFFLTENGQKRKKIVTQKIAKLGSNLYSDLEQIQEQIYQLDQNEKGLHLETHSQIISLLGAKILKEYELYKDKKGLLDYDDLITKTCALLNDNDTREWVLYKLDGFINHLLVDEAQDTSLEQWKIIEALIAEFYAGESSSPKIDRTIFVVGDEKQSIFSFQGANVESFSHMNKLLKYKMIASQKSFENVDLEISYRSAKEILEVVFNVFRKIQQKNSAIFSNPIIELQAFRENHSGRVELWPIVMGDKQQDSFWSIVTSNTIDNSPKKLLAEKISDYIKTTIEQGDVLAATGKPVTNGDFMILFRRRDELTIEVIKALQKNQLAVSGLDRIILKDNLSVQDLLSVARFVLNPDDDLNIASLLKSPLIKLSEDIIRVISEKRAHQSIWQLILSDEHKLYIDILNLLNIFLEIYSNNTSYFFQYIVDVLGYRAILNDYNGADSNDAINELIYVYRDYVNQIDESLQSFIYWIDDNESSVKRDDISSDKIKIMTVHASKGLQAPIVILCDTTSVPTNIDRFYWDKNENFLTAKKSDFAPDYYQDLKKIQQQKIYAEYLRLLYVGMTRAEDRLIVCGYQGERIIPENCWYKLVEEVMNQLETNNKDSVLIYGQDNNAINSMLQPSTTQQNIIEFYPQILECKMPINADIPSAEIISYKNPLSHQNPLEYGLIFHKILEDSIKASNLNIMKEHPLLDNLDKKYKNRMHKSIDLIINNKIFEELVQNPCQTEISIGSMLNEKINLGRVDLIITLDNKIVIVDYKSDLHPPAAAVFIPDSYKKQLNNYHKIFSEIYPYKIILTKILWLENGQLMDV